MANIVPFEGGNLPDYLRTQDAALNEDLTSHVGAGFPLMSIKGKVFTLVRGDERKIVPNPKDPESPATYIDAVLVKVNKNTSKTFYLKGYTEGSEATKPDCFSRDGVTPDPMSESPQAKSCATCKWNVWGSKVGENNQKGKACQDNVRAAISQASAIGDAMLLRIPPASIKALGEYGKVLKTRGVGYQAVITRIGFEVESPTPKLTFKPIGFLPEAAYKKVQEVAQGDVVQAILGDIGASVSDPADPVEKAKEAAATPVKQEPPSKTVSQEEVEQAVKAAESLKAAPKPETASVADIEINLDDLKFDD